MRKTTLLFFAITLLATSCNSNKNVQIKGTPINFSLIKTGNNSGYNEFKTIVIQNHEELISVWKQLFVKYDRKAPIPNIDFENKIVIATMLGQRNSGGYAIKITSVTETKQNISVNIEETKPGSACNSTTVMVYPFHLIEIPKPNKGIVFTRTIKVKECKKGF